MRKLLHTALAALVIGSAAPAAQAADNVVLVELFTSQGCSSCPPADANLAALADREDVLALSLHVDYWDYLGWRDTFASPSNTHRQYAYRDLLGARVIYTPQMIVHGRVDVPGYRPTAIEDAISQFAAAEAPASIRIAETEGMLAARIETAGPLRRCTVWMASYRKSATVDIARGENAGEELTYHNVVDKLMKVGSWLGDLPESIDLPAPAEGEGVAVWIQDDRTGQILAASFVED